MKPKLGENNKHFGSSLKNIAAIWKLCSPAFKEDLKKYAFRRSEYYPQDEISAHTNYAHFIRFLHNFRADNPEIDLAVVTKEELATAGIPTNVAAIVTAGLLPVIGKATDLINDW